MGNPLHTTAVIVETEEIQPGMVVRVLYIEGESRLQLVLVIDDNTNFDLINKNRKELKGLLSVINKKQGSDLNNKYEREIYGLVKWREEGISWKNLALMLNFHALALAIMAFDESQTPGIETPNLVGTQKQITDARYLSTRGGIALVYTFLGMGMALIDFNRWMTQVFDSMKDEQTLYAITSEPFQKDYIRDKVRYLTGKINNGKTFISDQDSSWNSLEGDIYMLNQGGHIQKTSAFLDKNGMQDWSRNKNILQRKIKEILDKWESSNDPKVNAWREIIRNSGKNLRNSP